MQHYTSWFIASPENLQVDFFCDRWELSDGNFYQALGELRKKGIVVSIASRLDLQFQSAST